MDTSHQKIAIWCGVFFVLCFGVGLTAVAPMVPPISPSSSAEQVSEFFIANDWRIKFGCWITMMGASFQIPLWIVLAYQMSRMEKGLPLLGFTQAASGSFNCAYFILGPVIWVTIAFRNELSPELALVFNDFGWILYLFITSPQIVQNLSIAAATLSNKTGKQVLPRWFGFLNIWVALGVMPAGFIKFLRKGPFAWDGIISFWLVIASFTVWITSVLIVLNKAVNEEMQNGGS